MSQQPAPAEKEEGYVKSPYSVGERTIEEIIADLSKPVPRRLLQSKTVGGQQILYIPWHTAVKMLDYRAPGWTWKITHVMHGGGRFAMVGCLSIPANLNGTIWWYERDATGTEGEEQDKYGDPVSNSESMCFRRSAAKFGLALGLYKGAKESQQEQPRAPHQGQSNVQRPQRAQGQAQSQPQRQGSADDITPKQLGYARTLASERGVDENAFSRMMFKLDLVDCNKTQAKAIIEKLLATKPKAAQQIEESDWGDETGSDGTGIF
jgi:hypothetical protein